MSSLERIIINIIVVVTTGLLAQKIWGHSGVDWMWLLGWFGGIIVGSLCYNTKK